MSPTQAEAPQLLQSLTPALRRTVIARADSILLGIVRANVNTQYASKSATLADFRDAISARGSASDTALVDDFRRCVPLTDYDAYRPFMAAFDKRPCKAAELENLFAPGLPFLLAVSSATSGKAPKLFPKYRPPVARAVFDTEAPSALILFYGYSETREVEREPGQIMKKIPVTTVTAGVARALLGCTDVNDDGSRMSTIIPGIVAPWATSMIRHHKSFLIIHALFTLTCRDLNRVFMSFSTLFYDLVRHVDEEWDMLLSSIRNGTVPDLPGMHEVHSHLQAHFHANPDRAAELREIGPPFSHEGWAARVWPKLGMIMFVCSGPFATILPKVKSITGPTIAIRSPGYGSSEANIAVPHRPDDIHTLVLESKELVEFLDVTAEGPYQHPLQAWELEVGKQYEIVLTTNDGLWRYRLGDVIDVIGFNVDSGAPVFLLSGRRSSAIRLAPMLIPDTSLVSAIQAVSPDVMQVSEFTAVLDDRRGAPTAGYLIELVGAPGPNAHLATSRLSEGLAAALTEFRTCLDDGRVGFPTVRVVRSGTFAAYRQWRAGKMNDVGPGQVKVPVVLVDHASKEWIIERVVGEL